MPRIALAIATSVCGARGGGSDLVLWSASLRTPADVSNLSLLSAHSGSRRAGKQAASDRGRRFSHYEGARPPAAVCDVNPAQTRRLCPSWAGCGVEGRAQPRRGWAPYCNPLPDLDDEGPLLDLGNLVG